MYVYMNIYVNKICICHIHHINTLNRHNYTREYTDTFTSTQLYLYIYTHLHNTYYIILHITSHIHAAYACTYKSTHEYTNVCTDTYIYVYMYTHVNLKRIHCICIHTILAHILHAHIHTHIHTYIHTYILTYIHTYTCKFIPSYTRRARETGRQQILKQEMYARDTIVGKCWAPWADPSCDLLGGVLHLWSLRSRIEVVS